MAWPWVLLCALVVLLGVVGLTLVLRLRAMAGLGALAKWTSAGGVVLDGRGRIALVQQRDRKGRWRWTLPKGRMDPGERPEATALREVYEESGLRVRIVRPLLRHEGRLHFTYYFEMALERDDGVHDDETRAVRFVALDQAVDLVRSRRDLGVLRRLVEMRTGVVSSKH